MKDAEPVRYRFKRSPTSQYEYGIAIKNKDFTFNLKRCEYFSLKNMDEQEFDIFYIISAVDYVDRIAIRKLSEGWEREFHIEVPVSSPSFWNNIKIKSSLSHVLNLLTGDKWMFSFCPRNGHSEHQKFLPINKDERYVIVPYSDGLDSYALGCLMPEVVNEHRQLRVTSWNSAINKGNKHICSPKIPRIAIPVSTSLGKRMEDSFRTRPFKFFLTAALVARKVGSDVIYIPENGQGTFGPSLVLKGVESAYLGTHPIFTNELREFIRIALDHDITFFHPNMWRTKGQVVSELIDKGFSWEGTKSCPLDGRSMRYKKRDVLHCGVCSSCILRRVALHYAGVANQEEYYYDNSTQCDIQINTEKNNVPLPSSSTYGMAFHAIESMERLANMLDNESGIRAVRQQAFWLGSHLEESNQFYEEALRQLITAHKKEWHCFLTSLSKKSWLRSVVEVLR